MSINATRPGLKARASATNTALLLKENGRTGRHRHLGVARAAFRLVTVRLPPAALDDALVEVVVRLVAARRIVEQVEVGKQPLESLGDAAELIDRARLFAEQARAAG